MEMDMQETLRQGGYSTDTNQEEITSKGMPDHDEFDQRVRNASNPAVAINCYTGAENPNNLHIIPMELLLARRDSNAYDAGSEPNMRVFSSLAGFYHGGYRGLEAAMRAFVFAGIAKTSYKVSSSQQEEAAVTYYIAGSGTMNNNGDGDIYPADHLEWYFPPTPQSLLSHPDARQPAGTDSAIVYQNSGGTPNTKPLVRIRRFDPYNWNTCLAGAWQTMTERPTMDKRTDAGIMGLTYEALRHASSFDDTVNLETLQEEALGFQNGLIMIALLIGQQLQAMQGAGEVQLNGGIQGVCQQLGLWTADGGADVDPAKQALRAKALRTVFKSYVDYETKATAKRELVTALQMGEADYERAIKAQYASNGASMAARLADDPLGMLMGAVTSAQQARRSRVFAKAIGGAGIGDDVHVLVGHSRTL